MIRHYNRIDKRRLKPNEFSSVGDLDFVFEDDNFMKHTLVDEAGDVKAMILFSIYYRGPNGPCAIAFFLISEDIKPREAVELKQFIHQAVVDFDAQRVQTESVACPVLDKWHEYLGFTLEGTREKMIHNRDYNMWGYLKGRDF